MPRVFEGVSFSWFQLEKGGKKSRITGFQDQSISDARVIIDVVDCLKRNSVNYDNVKAGDTEKVCENNRFPREFQKPQLFVQPASLD